MTKLLDCTLPARQPQYWDFEVLRIIAKRCLTQPVVSLRGRPTDWITLKVGHAGCRALIVDLGSRISTEAELDLLSAAVLQIIDAEIQLLDAKENSSMIVFEFLDGAMISAKATNREACVTAWITFERDLSEEDINEI